MKRKQADEFLERVARVQRQLAGSLYALAGGTARCLHMCRALPLDQWKRICHPWPEKPEVVGVESVPPDLARLCDDRVAREFHEAMLRSKEWLTLPGCQVPVPVVSPDFVLAQLLVDESPLIVSQVADLLRCLPRDYDLEAVRVLLKAVQAGEKFQTLQDVAYVI